MCCRRVQFARGVKWRIEQKKAERGWRRLAGAKGGSEGTRTGKGVAVTVKRKKKRRACTWSKLRQSWASRSAGSPSQQPWFADGACDGVLVAECIEAVIIRKPWRGLDPSA